MLRPLFKASYLGAGVLKGGSIGIEVISLTYHPSHIINHLA
jgi:hypothetical protein